MVKMERTAEMATMGKTEIQELMVHLVGYNLFHFYRENKLNVYFYTQACLVLMEEMVMMGQMVLLGLQGPLDLLVYFIIEVF